MLCVSYGQPNYIFAAIAIFTVNMAQMNVMTSYNKLQSYKSKEEPTDIYSMPKLIYERGLVGMYHFNNMFHS
jgi:hypothetical protein